jgi:hypothetical protein
MAWPPMSDWMRTVWNAARMPGQSHRGPLPAADTALEELAGRLRADVVELAAKIGERNVRRRPRELAEAADWIDARLAATGLPATRQEYSVDDTPCHNIELEIPGTKLADQIVVVGAHYDSVVGCPGANDNGSGVAALVSLAGMLTALPPAPRTLRLVAFVNEEAPYAHSPLMGSWVYARACRRRAENITAMLSLETIGYYSDQPGSQRYPPGVGKFYPSEGNFIGFVGSVRYARLVRQAVEAFRRNEPFPSQGGALPESIPNIGFSDHWSFWQEGYPALMVTDTAPFRYPYYHLPEDTWDQIDYPKMARVVRGLRWVVDHLRKKEEV